MNRLLPLLMAAMLLLPAPVEVSNDPPDVKIVAPYYIVVDADDPSIVFYERDPDERWIPASTMKIMTCILTIEHVEDYDEPVVVTKQAANMKETNSLMKMYAGETLTVDQLLHGLMLVSGNDAALMLATHIAGGVAEYTDLANAKAAELGMVNSHFLNASGAFRGGQYSTARDMALLTAYALKNEKFLEIISTVTYTIEPNGPRKKTSVLKSTNRLISDDPETGAAYCSLCIGGKTGSTLNGGKCLVAAAELDGARVIVVLIGADDLNSYDVNRRMPKVFANAKFLLEYTLENDYTPVTPGFLDFTYSVEVASAAGAAPLAVSARFDESAVRRLPNAMAKELAADITQMEVTTELYDALADAKAGDVVGSISCTYQGYALFSGELVAESDAVVTPMPTVEQLTNTPEPAPQAEADDRLANIHPGVFVFGGLSVLLTASMVALGVMIIKKRRS
jgi:D-alanyl-D-alanine carboxypeptidase